MSEVDPIWGETANYLNGDGSGGLVVESARCGGRFRIAGSALVSISSLSPAEKAKLTTLIVESNRAGQPFLVTTYVMDALKNARPFSVSERIDRLLAYFAHRGYRPGTRLDWLGTHSPTPQTERSTREACAWIEAEHGSEIGAFRELLEGMGYLRNVGGSVSITAPGFARMDEMRRGGAPTNQVFVAMWFGAEMFSAYEEGIAPAIRDAGFDPVRIDRKEHVNKIDDEIIAEIKRARFMVADFTSGLVETNDGPIHVPRGGVYYEAGFAQGRDIPIIWCVRDDQINDVHFDIRQFNQIAWKYPADLRARLHGRIRALFAEAH